MRERCSNTSLTHAIATSDRAGEDGGFSVILAVACPAFNPMLSFQPLFSIMSRPERDDVQLQLLTLLRDDPQLSQRELSERMGVSVGLTNYCMRALVEKGWVQAQRFIDNDRKTRYLYKLTPSGLRHKLSLTKRFLTQKRAEYALIQQEIALLEEQLRDDEESDQRT